jgi:hypothetical protein
MSGGNDESASEKKGRFRAMYVPGDATATVEVSPDGEASARLTMTLEQLTEYIASMAKVRQEMVAGKPLPALEGVQIDAIYDTRWHVQPSESPPGSVLTFYHPGFGPVAFVVPLPQVPQIAGYLSSQVAFLLAKLEGAGSSEEKPSP